MAQIVTAQFVGQTSCGFVRNKYYEIEISAGRSGCLCVAPFRFAFCDGSIIPRNAPAVNRGGAVFLFWGCYPGHNLQAKHPAGGVFGILC